MAKGENTRSGLLWEVERLLNECTELPQILLMENVTQVHGKKNIEHFNEWIRFLESKGYRNYWKDLNAKNFCIPQNRNRTFMVSILGDYTYEFPQEFPLNKRLKDLLEMEVDEKFYIKNFDSLTSVNSEYSMINGGTIGKMHDVSRRVYSGEGVSPTIHTCGGGNTEPKVVEPRVIGGIDTRIADEYKEYSNFYVTPRGSDGKLINGSYNRVWKAEKYCGALNLTKQQEVAEKDYQNTLRIRKLTPKECWRLMGFTDEDFEKAAQYNSNSQLYKQAGNSIVVSVLYYIFKGMM